MSLPTLYSLCNSSGAWRVKSWKPYKETTVYYCIGSPDQKPSHRIHKDAANVSPWGAWDAQISLSAQKLEFCRVRYEESVAALKSVLEQRDSWEDAQ